MFDKNPNQTTISISTWSVVKIFLILLAFWFFYQVREVILIIFVAIMLASILESPVSWLQKRKIPRAVTVILIYLIFFAVLSFLTLSLIPPLIEQIRQLANNFPDYLQKVFAFFRTPLGDFINLNNGVQELAKSVASGTTNNFLTTIFSFFGGFVSTIVVLVMTFYLVVEEDALKRIIRSVVPDHYQPYITQLFSRVQSKLGAWLRGQLILSLIVGILIYIGLTLLRVPYALVLAPMAGLLEFVPFIGPITAAAPSVIIALAQSPIKALVVIAMYVMIQQMQNHILVPKVMQKAVGINPIISIAAVLTGVQIGGVLGALIAIPLTAALSVLIKDFYHEVRSST